MDFTDLPPDAQLHLLAMKLEDVLGSDGRDAGLVAAAFCLICRRERPGLLNWSPAPLPGDPPVMLFCANCRCPIVPAMTGASGVRWLTPRNARRAFRGPWRFGYARSRYL